MGNEDMDIREKYEAVKQREREAKKLYGLPVVATTLCLDSMMLSKRPIKNTLEALQLISEKLCSSPRELGILLLFDSEQVPICMAQIAMGTHQEVQMTPRDMIQIALLCNASSAITIHNHPTLVSDGRNLKPSQADIIAADMETKLFALHGIVLRDSVIVAGFRESKLFGRIPAYYSMQENNLMKLIKKNYPDKKPYRDKIEEEFATRLEDICWDMTDAKEYWDHILPGATDSYLDKWEIYAEDLDGEPIVEK